MIATILGLLCLLVAIIFIINYVEELQLGKYSSKLLAVIFALIAYYSFAQNLIFIQPSPISLKWIKWVIPIALSGFAIFMIIQIWKNANEEGKSIIMASKQLVLVVVFLILARFLFGWSW